MIDALKPYEAYSDSGQPWWPLLPSHWAQRRMKFLFRERVQKGFPNEPLLAATQSQGVVAKTDYGVRTVTASKDFHLLKLVEKGDFVISLRSFQGGIEISHARGIISPAYTVLQPVPDGRPRYFAWLLKSAPFISSLGLNVTGIREGQNIDYERLSRSYLPLPPAEEQEAIARFLDWANGRLERAIRAKRKVIALLNEQKQAIILRAVTKGVSGAGQHKSTGIHWVGDIPVNWDVRRVKQIARIARGKFSHRPRNDPSLYNGAYPFIQTGAVAQASKFITSYTQTLNERGLAVSKLFPRGTLAMTIAANIGDVAVLGFDSCFPDSIVGFFPTERVVDRDYLYLVFVCMKAELLRDAPVNTQGNLNVERIGSMGLPVPPLGEQQRIANFVKEKTTGLDSRLRRLNHDIEMLREYRNRLVADVVTGQLDVREASITLPNDASSYALDISADLGAEAEHANEEDALP